MLVYFNFAAYPLSLEQKIFLTRYFTFYRLADVLFRNNRFLRLLFWCIASVCLIAMELYEMSSFVYFVI